MKKGLIALAVAGALCAPLAQADATLFKLNHPQYVEMYQFDTKTAIGAGIEVFGTEQSTTALTSVFGPEGDYGAVAQSVISIKRTNNKLHSTLLITKNQRTMIATIHASRSPHTEYG